MKIIKKIRGVINFIIDNIGPEEYENSMEWCSKHDKCYEEARKEHNRVQIYINRSKRI